MKTTMEKFARKCSITGRGMNDGWCINEGDMYVHEETDMLRHLKETDYATLQEAYNDGYCYWSEWDADDDDTYFDAEGNEFNQDGTPFTPEPVAMLNRHSLMDTEVWKTRFCFADIYEYMDEEDKKVIDLMTDEQLQEWINENSHSMTKGFESGMMFDWSAVASTVSSNLSFPEIKYKHQRHIGNEWEDTEHDGEGNVIIYDTKAEADKSLQEYIDDVNDAHAKGDMETPYEDDCKVVEFFEAI